MPNTLSRQLALAGALAVVVGLFPGCAASSAEESAAEDEGDTAPNPEALRVTDATNTRGVLSRLGPIPSEVVDIPPDVKRQYFASALGSEGKDSNGRAYQFFGGASDLANPGLGAVYMTNNGARYLYGPILTEWARQHYENGPLGYPADEPDISDTGVEQTFATERPQPTDLNQGLTEVRRTIVWGYGDERATVLETRLYLDSNSEQLSPVPLNCQYVTVTSASPVISEQYGPYELLWCGAEFPGYTDPNESVDHARI